MKKILLILVCTILMVPLAQGRSIKVQKSNGGPNGYQTVMEDQTDNWLLPNYSHLTCTDPGNNSCSWTVHPSMMPDMTGPSNIPCPFEDLQAYAKAQISSSTLSGTYYNNIELSGDYWYRTVTWDASDSENYTIIVDVNLAE